MGLTDTNCYISNNKVLLYITGNYIQEIQYLIVNYMENILKKNIKNLPVMQETLVQFLGQEDMLEKG